MKVDGSACQYTRAGSKTLGLVNDGEVLTAWHCWTDLGEGKHAGNKVAVGNKVEIVIMGNP